MANQFKYIEVKTHQTGRCNICTRKSVLTWDHVPPAGGIELTPVEIRSILQTISPDSQVNRPLISQNGLKYRTLCGECNSKLGLKFDPVLNQFALGIGSFLKSSLTLPRFLSFRTRPTALIRAILGHLLAAKAHFDDATTDVSMRSIIFDESAPIPESLNVFYWIYPFQEISVYRNVVMPAVRGRLRDVATFDVLKYFPLAYLLTDAKSYEGLQELTVFRSLRSDEFADVQIDLKALRDFDWPERTDPGNIVIFGQPITSAVIAQRRRK